MVKSQMRRQDKPVVGYGRQSISSLMAIRTPSRTDIGSPETEFSRYKKVQFTEIQRHDFVSVLIHSNQ